MTVFTPCYTALCRAGSDQRKVDRVLIPHPTRDGDYECVSTGCRSVTAAKRTTCRASRASGVEYDFDEEEEDIPWLDGVQYRAPGGWNHSGHSI